jgi:hypothetical protein
MAGMAVHHVLASATAHGLSPKADDGRPPRQLDGGLRRLMGSPHGRSFLLVHHHTHLTTLANPTQLASMVRPAAPLRAPLRRALFASPLAAAPALRLAGRSGASPAALGAPAHARSVLPVNLFAAAARAYSQSVGQKIPDTSACLLSLLRACTCSPCAARDDGGRVGRLARRLGRVRQAERLPDA